MSDSNVELSSDIAKETSGLTPSSVYRGWNCLPGYRMIRRLGAGGLGEVFEVEAPGGFGKAMKLVRLGRENPLGVRELESLRSMRTIHHPFLLSIDRVDVHDDILTILMELADGSLQDVHQRSLHAGRRGLPRERLLSALAEVAEALDFLNLRHGLQHLDVKPSNLFLVAGRLKVGDYGLMRAKADGVIDREINAISPGYSAPELLDGKMTAASDQYSLAIVYTEMLTGRRPYCGSDVRQILFQQLTAGPSLQFLPPGDRPIIAKALSPNPRRRFVSCRQLVGALRLNHSDSWRQWPREGHERCQYEPLPSLASPLSAAPGGLERRCLRRFVRTPAEGAVLIFATGVGRDGPVDTMAVCTLIDKSPGGIGVVSPVPLVPGPARLRLLGGAAQAARIVYCNEGSDRCFRVGLALAAGASNRSLSATLLSRIGK